MPEVSTIVRSSSSTGFSLNPLMFFSSVLHNHALIREMVIREIKGRYRASLLGMLWFVLTPLFLITIYTIVFGVVFQVRTPVRAAQSTGVAEFGIYLFSGLLVFTIFSDVISRSSSLIVENVNYVKKVVFPLEILPVVVLLTALAHGLAAFLALLGAMLIVLGSVPPTAVLFPLVIMMLLPMLLGFSWVLAGVGTYVRDLSQFIGMVLTCTMFLSPIFIPLANFPGEFQTLVLLNPVSVVVETGRTMLFDTTLMPLGILATYLTLSCLVMFGGWVVFQKLRVGFADVL